MKHPKKNRRQSIAEKAARLAPPEERAAHESGAMHRSAPAASGSAASSASTGTVVGASAANDADTTAGRRESSAVPLRKTSLDENFDGTTWLGMRRVMVIILALCLTFIAGIAYLISLQP